MSYKVSTYVHITKREDIHANTFFLYAIRTGAILELSNEYYDILVSQRLDDLPVPLLNDLVKFEAVVLQAENELNSLLDVNKQMIKKKDEEVLSITVQPTANCQLGCSYCGQKHEKKVSDSNTSQAIIRRVISKINSSTKTLYLKWYGGEPLTGLSSINEISEALLAFCKNKEIYYGAGMVTNGLALKPGLFFKLVEDLKINDYQITLDGTSEYHDKRRYLKTGGPSFELIFSNLKHIISSPLFDIFKPQIKIRSNVDGQNKDNIFELIDLLYENGVLHKAGFYIAPIIEWGANGASKINGISREEFARIEIEVFLKLKELNVLKREILIPKRKYNVCMVASSSSEVYDAYGNVSTCWEVPYTPLYQNSKYYAGNLLKNPDLDSSELIMRKWFDEIPGNHTWCKTCKFLPVCGGGCPKQWNQGEIPCPSFKFNIDERILLRKATA